MMRVIFLDIDGVLNSCQYNLWLRETKGENDDLWLEYRSTSEEDFSSYEKMLCQYCCTNLRHILKTYPDVRIVVSSTWRNGRSIEKLNALLKYHKIFDSDEDKVIGKTPSLHKERGLEIFDWLSNNPNVSDFIILDDDSDMDMYLDTPHFLQTNGKVGFDYLAMEYVDKYFGGFNLKFDDVVEGVPYKMYSKLRSQNYFREGNEMVYYENGTRHSVFFYPNFDIFSKVVV